MIEDYYYNQIFCNIEPKNYALTMTEKLDTFSGWGNFPKSQSSIHFPEAPNFYIPKSKKALARGCGRSYGDAALNKENYLILMSQLNRVLDFDFKFGILRAQSGCTLEELIKFLVPKGWFLPVTPGTQYVTLGGCLAADVHGKNHHWDGCFSNFVLSFTLILADGSIVYCSRNENCDLFFATIGGMGLTGVILEITLQLLKIPSAYITVKYEASLNLEETLEKLLHSKQEDKYSVAWVDCLSKGRSIIMNGHHATREEIPLKISNLFEIKRKSKKNIPCYFPSWVLNKQCIKIFNKLFYFLNKNKNHQIVDFENFFYPLDAILNWNRLYGKKGFFQYQCVIPFLNGGVVLKKILNELNRANQTPFLAVLKKMGQKNEAPLSFPIEGFTLALDIPFKNEEIFNVLDRIDQMVLENEGKIYLAKDARAQHKIIKKMYPKFEDWLKIKLKYDEKIFFQSDLSRRLNFF